MKNDIHNTRKQGWLTLAALVVIAIAVYIGFTPLFNLIEGGIAGRVLGSSFGAIFVIVLTMFLLNKQTEIEQESKKGERVFDEKVKIYQQILDITRDMLIDGNLSQEEINRLPFPVIRLQMLGGDETIESFQKVFEALNKVYSEDEADTVKINDDDRGDIYQLLSDFACICRQDLGISNNEINSEIKKETIKTISDSGKKGKDLTKFSFNGVELPKNKYIHSVIKNYVDENPNITINEFSKKVIERTPEKLPKRNNIYEIWKTYDEAIELYEQKGHKRYFVTKRGGNYLKDKDLVISLADEQICISNQWSIDSMSIFIDIVREKGLRTE